MIITFIVIVILLLVFLSGKIRLHLRFRKQVATLYTNLGTASCKIYNDDQLSNLPGPVQRYFKYALTPGQPYISTTRLQHTGLFKTGLEKKFIPITGEQHFTVPNPQFIWKGRTSFFTAVDSYITGRGSLKVALLDIFTVADGHGSSFDEGELQRWIAESVWFPTNLLPSETVSWSAINENAAKLAFCYKGISFHFIVTFNAQGQITVMETQRFMTGEKRETWICRMSDYRKINGLQVPFSASVSWKLPAGDYTYAKFQVVKIEYNIPKSF